MKPSHKVPTTPWQMQQRVEDEETKGFLGFPINQSTPASPSVHGPPSVPDPAHPPLPTNGERRPRGRPPKNCPWGKIKNSTRVGRPPKIRPMEDEDDEDDEILEEGRTAGSSSSPPSLFSMDRQGDSSAFHSLDLARHPSITPTTRRGRPPRKKRGPKPRLPDGTGEGLTQSVLFRLNEAASVNKSCFSESSDDEEEEDDDEDDEEERGCSPPILTKPAIGLKCKVRNWLKLFELEMHQEGHSESQKSNLSSFAVDGVTEGSIL